MNLVRLEHAYRSMADRVEGAGNLLILGETDKFQRIRSYDFRLVRVLIRSDKLSMKTLLSDRYVREVGKEAAQFHWVRP